jgi:hypothetical protein
MARSEPRIVTTLIFRVVLWYALLKGARAGLKPAPPMTLAGFDRLLKRLYITPIREQLAMSPLDWQKAFAPTPNERVLFEGDPLRFGPHVQPTWDRETHAIVGTP